ncbi:hypothetical protein FXF62_09555 [Streptococcus cristatus]|uniref:Uncharacterized protein n=1 Tax=Streptococcus cristatus TaxID=45634 RepID=A0A5B0D9G5_STRCR|nr:hypothetical protein FXF62_09555 [Streptococcus cristatus]
MKVAKENYNKKPSQKLLKSHQKEIYFLLMIIDINKKRTFYKNFQKSLDIPSGKIYNIGN